MSQTNLSKIDYRGTGADGRPVDSYYAWNPGGFGCSGGCDGCWSHAMAQRFGVASASGHRELHGCLQCARFAVHLHRERLTWPTTWRKPGVVLCNFTCDTFDQARPSDQIVAMLGGSVPIAAMHHAYVWLTKNPSRMLAYVAGWSQQFEPTPLAERIRAGHYWGLTIRDQLDANRLLPEFLTISGNLWLSLEPLAGPLNLTRLVHGDESDLDALRGRIVHTQQHIAIKPDPVGQRIGAVIVGQDNRRGMAGTETLANVRSLVAQCRAAGVPIFVKQLWLLTCPKCRTTYDDGSRGDHAGDECSMDDCGGRLRWRLHTDPAAFPQDLALRDLPWSKPTESARTIVLLHVANT